MNLPFKSVEIRPTKGILKKPALAFLRSCTSKMPSVTTVLKNTVSFMCKTRHTLTASMGIKKVSSSSVLLIKCTWLTDHQSASVSTFAKALTVCCFGTFRYMSVQVHAMKNE